MMECMFRLLAALLFAVVLGAQPPAPEVKDPLGRETPQGSVFQFLEACHARDYSKALRYLDLRRVPQAERAHDAGHCSEPSPARPQCRLGAAKGAGTPRAPMVSIAPVPHRQGADHRQHVAARRTGLCAPPPAIMPIGGGSRVPRSKAKPKAAATVDCRCKPPCSCWVREARLGSIVVLPHLSWRVTVLQRQKTTNGHATIYICHLFRFVAGHHDAFGQVAASRSSIHRFNERSQSAGRINHAGSRQSTCRKPKRCNVLINTRSAP